MKPLLFVSGWAGCECLYPRLASISRYLIPFIRHQEQEIAGLLRQGGSTLMAWSTGAHIVLKQLPDILDLYERVILAAPFLSFTRYVPRARLEAMIANMTKDPSRTADHFMAKCGHCGPLSITEPEYPSLVRGLTFLLTSEAVLPKGLSGKKVTLIHGERDRIVPVQASLDLHAMLPGSTLLLPHTGHKIDESILLDLVT
jgi:pimeloyl-ACP methyl ester carboxylesterase